ncbi:unnamed protein product [Sphagnum tenellum]
MSEEAAMGLYNLQHVSQLGRLGSIGMTDICQLLYRGAVLHGMGGDYEGLKCSVYRQWLQHVEELIGLMAALQSMKMDVRMSNSAWVQAEYAETGVDKECSCRHVGKAIKDQDDDLIPEPKEVAEGSHKLTATS